jgi:DNA-(apurinic or apyrimidinic site) lyase
MEKLLEILSSLDSEDIALIITHDRQYRALLELYPAVKDEELFFKLVTVNALLSYQLPCPGEEYWEKFSRFFAVKQSLQSFEEFLKKHNRRLLRTRLERLKRVLACLEGKELSKMTLREVREHLSGCLKQRKDSKTILFAVKMLTYCHRITRGREPEGVEEFPVPIDSRLSKVSKEPAFWKELSAKSGIPQLHLDAIFWNEPLPELPDRLKRAMMALKTAVKDLNLQKPRT